MSANLTSNNLDLMKWQQFLGFEIIFLALFSKSILVIEAKLRRDIDRDKGHLAHKFDLK